ncbi:MAG: glycerophosphodiester phosphodiesterase [Acidimicrobiales bacterium]
MTGASGPGENTLAAFEAARAAGADGVELDARRTADGVLVVHHDPVLPDGRPVHTLRAAELPDHVPTLEAALECCRGLVVDAEVKNLPTEPGFDPTESVAAAVAELAARMGVAGDVVVSSFSLPSVDAARAAGTGVATAWLTLAAYDQLEALALAADHGHDALQPRHEAVTAELVAAAHQRGLDVHAWTVDDPERIEAMATAGVDAVITNRPDVALRALGR